jgi:hypothetical protein
MAVFCDAGGEGGDGGRGGNRAHLCVREGVCVCVRVRVCVYECMRTLNIWHVRVHVPVW